MRRVRATAVAVLGVLCFAVLQPGMASATTHTERMVASPTRQTRPVSASAPGSTPSPPSLSTDTAGAGMKAQCPRRRVRVPQRLACPRPC
jgi:hypothetical protein